MSRSTDETIDYGAARSVAPGIPRRRLFALTGGGLTLGTSSLIVAGSHDSPAFRGPTITPPFDYPFTLGVASGDPWPDSVVLWTRLLPDVNRPEAMPDSPVTVEWQLADDERFRAVVRSGETTATPEDAHSVHVEAFGLEPDRRYFYRFRSGGHISPVGRTRTAPAPGEHPDLRFVTASCQSLPDGYFSAYRHIAAADPDFVVFLGDWIYESDAATIEDPVRSHQADDPVTLAEYRYRHALYRADPDLRAASAACPFIATFDDHEVVDNWYAETEPADPNWAGFPDRRLAAFRAFYEHLPLRPAARPTREGMRIHRSIPWGSTLDLYMMDTRQYRDPMACGGGREPEGCGEMFDPSRSMLGAAQQEWLFGELGGSSARWRALGQQVPMGRYDYTRDPATAEYLMDRWDGYPSARQELLDFIVERELGNLMVLSGDAHAHMATDLTYNMADPDTTPMSSDLVCTSISTTGDGVDEARLEGEPNPHLRFSLWRRGFIEHTLDDSGWRARFQVVPYVSAPDAPLETRASYVVESGRAGLQED